MAVVIDIESVYMGVAGAIEVTPIGNRRIAGLTSLSAQIGTGAVIRLYRSTFPVATLAAQSAPLAAPLAIDIVNHKILVPQTTMSLLTALTVAEAFYFRIERVDGSAGFKGFIPPDLVLQRDAAAGEDIVFPAFGFALPSWLDGISTTITPPTLLTPGSIAGSPVEKQLLTATAAVYSGAAVVTTQWWQGQTPIEGATGLQLLLDSGDVGKLINFVTTATNEAGTVQNFATVGPIVSAPPAPTPAPPPPPPAPAPSCTITFTGAASSIAANVPLTYTLSTPTGSTVFQTWLVEVGTGTNIGGGTWVNGQTPTSTGPGAYSNNLTNVAPGNYLIWARVNDGGVCQDAIATRPVTVTAAPVPPPAPVPSPAPAPSGSVRPYAPQVQSKVGALTFRDEFKGNSLNLSKWNRQFGYYSGTPNYQDLNNFSVHDDYLEIWLARNSDNNVWTFGRTINSENKFEQKYGYFEARMKLPIGSGTWPAFWLYGERFVPHPEIDIIEAYGRGVGNSPTQVGGPANGDIWNDGISKPLNYSVALHLADGNNDVGALRLAHTVFGYPMDVTSTFHHFGCLWEADGITFFYDDRQVGDKFYRTDLNQPMFLLPTMGASGGKETISPWINGTSPMSQGTGLLFDWVRAWALQPPAVGQTVTSGTATNPTSE